MTLLKHPPSNGMFYVDIWNIHPQTVKYIPLSFCHCSRFCSILLIGDNFVGEPSDWGADQLRVAGQEMTTSKGQGTLNLFGFSSFGFVTLLKLKKINLS